MLSGNEILKGEGSGDESQLTKGFLGIFLTGSTAQRLCCKIYKGNIVRKCGIGT